jgi:ethanolamine utilization protein EutA (predicted chaperonin)
MTFTNSSKQPLVSILDPSESALAGNFLGLSVLSFNNSGCVVALDANGGGTRNVTLHVEVVGR